MKPAYLPGIRNKRLEYRSSDGFSEDYFATLDQYLEWAKQSIYRFVPRIANFLLSNDDAVSDIAHLIMMGDWRWNGQGDRKGYRSKCARWAISTYLKGWKANKKKYPSLLSLDQLLGNGSISRSGEGVKLSDIIPIKEKANHDEQINFLLESSSLTERQRSHLLKCLNGQSPAEISREEGVSREAVSKSLRKAMKKFAEFKGQPN